MLLPKKKVKINVLMTDAENNSQKYEKHPPDEDGALLRSQLNVSGLTDK